MANNSGRKGIGNPIWIGRRASALGSINCATPYARRKSARPYLNHHANAAPRVTPKRNTAKSIEQNRQPSVKLRAPMRRATSNASGGTSVWNLPLGNQSFDGRHQNRDPCRLFHVHAPAAGPWKVVVATIGDERDVAFVQALANLRAIAVTQPMIQDGGRQAGAFNPAQGAIRRSTSSAPPGLNSGR